MAKDVTNPNNNWILVLDDEFDILHPITELLKRHGFSVYGLTEPLLALEHFKSNSKDYSLVISDARMPEMTGFEFVRKVKALNWSSRSKNLISCFLFSCFLFLLFFKLILVLNFIFMMIGFFDLY
jgi:CheY-like chemotaxis protein